MRKLKINFDPETEAKWVDLVLRAQSGDNDAYAELSETHISIIEHYAKFFGRNSTIPQEDIINFGRIGLSTAIKEFETTRKSGFPSFATANIRDEIMKGIEELKAKHHS